MGQSADNVLHTSIENLFYAAKEIRTGEAYEEEVANGGNDGTSYGPLLIPKIMRQAISSEYVFTRLFQIQVATMMDVAKR